MTGMEPVFIRDLRCGLLEHHDEAPVLVVIRVGFLEKRLHKKNEFTRFTRRQVAGTACAKAWKPEHTRFVGIVNLGGLKCNVCGKGIEEIGCHFPYSVIFHDIRSNWCFP